MMANRQARSKHLPKGCLAMVEASKTLLEPCVIVIVYFKGCFIRRSSCIGL